MSGWFTNNLGLKLLSLIIAILLELYFYSPDNSVTAEISIPVDIKNLSTTQMIVGPSGADRGLVAMVNVRGPSPLVDQVKGMNHRFSINIPNDASKRVRKVVDQKQLRMPSGVEIVSINPAKIDFELEHVVKKELPVNLDLLGEPAEGFIVERIKIFPKTIFAKGPKSELQGLSSIPTEQVDIQNIIASKRVDVSVINDGRMTTLGVNVVNVEIVVKEVEATKTFEKVFVKVLAPKGYAATVQPSKVKAVLAGPLNELEKLSKRSLELSADGRKLKDGEHKVSLTGELPPGVELLRTIPEQVKIKLVTTDG